MKTIEQIELAIKNNEFYLEYMPTIDLMTNQCVGAEALVRWLRHDKIIPPNDFIPDLKGTPQSGLITYWVIEKVFEDLGMWLDRTANVHIGINVPPELLGRGGLWYAAIKSGLIKFSDKVMLEITEQGFPDQMGLDVLRSFEMKEQVKVKVAIDDFGMGDANLFQLSQIEADFIKLDKYFVGQISSEKEIPKIVKGIISFAKEMDFKIIAEGIETQTQLNVLKGLGVELAQGWLFSKSLTPDVFIEYHRDKG
jgi:sensor c-di-GMP phosphodiesterase-like protein